MLNVEARLKAIEAKKNGAGVYILFLNRDGTASVTIKEKKLTFPYEEKAREAIYNDCRDPTIIVWDLELLEGY